MFEKIQKFIAAIRNKTLKYQKSISALLEKFPILRISIFFIASRVIIYIFALIAFGILTNRITPISDIFLEQWWRWDSVHYVNIANHGYVNFGDERFNIAFLPLYPFLIFLVSLIGFHPLISGILISNIAALIAVIYFYKLVKLDFADIVAEKTVFFLLIFPTAYFLSAAYTEALFLAFIIAGFYYARKDKWILAGFLGMLAALTRNAGIIIFIALLFEYLWQKNFDLKKIKPDILALILIPTGSVIYLLINQAIYGDYWHFLDVLREHWYKYPAFPWKGYETAANSALWRLPSDRIMIGFIEIAFAFLGLIASLFAFRIRISYGIYAFSSWLLITSTSFWLSIPRYTLTIFPVFIVFALWSKNRIYNYILTFASLLFLSLFAIQFILGRWAF